MNCKLTQSIIRDCDYNVAGIRRLYLFNYTEQATYTTDSDGVVSAITLPTGEKVYKMEFQDDSASFQDDLTVGSNDSHKYRVPTVTFILNKLSVDVLNKQIIYHWVHLFALIVDMNGDVTLLGSDNGLKATSDNYTSGAAAGDANGWTVILTGREHSVLKKVEKEAVFTSLVDVISVTEE